MKKYHVVSHTHWDREWYGPFESFRLRLVDLIDRLLVILEEQDNYIFHMDAQTIALDDYLEIRSEKQGILEKYIREGRILTGPWYVQNDFFLSSGESTVRNLLIGTRDSEKYGKCMYVGYMPDQFGLISQIPQILNGFSINTAVFGRGYHFDKPGKAEFSWKAPDGSEVLAVNMPFWYNNAQRFPEDPKHARLMLERINSNLEATSSTDKLLLMNGVDHLEAQENLLPILETLNASLDKEERIFQSTLPEYLTSLENTLKTEKIPIDTFTGELRYGKKDQVLNGTLSSRAYLKRRNFRSQKKLEHQLEPFFSILGLLGINRYPKDQLRYAWKTLIQNHAHDDICGCSIDPVHRHMEDRFERVEEITEELTSHARELLNDHLDKKELPENAFFLTIVNTLPYLRNAIVDAEIDIPAEDRSRSFEIISPEGTPVPYTLNEKKHRTRGTTSRINLPGMIEVDSYRFTFPAENVPAMGYTNYLVIPREEISSSTAGRKSEQKMQIENEYLRVMVNPNGTLNIENRKTGIKFSNLLLLEDSGDAGDSYIYHAAPDKIIHSASVEINMEQQEINEFYQSIRYSFALEIPRNYNRDTKQRSSDLVRVPVTVNLKLSNYRKELDVSMEIDNRAEDHRIRVLFPTGITGKKTYASTPFDIVERDRNLIDTGVLKVPEQPTDGLIGISDGRKGLAVLTRGIYEYEHMADEQTLALTLFRSTGFISNPLESSLPMDESWLVPENQCPGIHQCDFSITLFRGSVYDEELQESLETYAEEMIVFTSPVDKKRYGGGRPFVQDDDIQTMFYRDPEFPDISLPRENSLFHLEGEPLRYSILKAAESTEEYVLRLFNPSPETRKSSIVMNKKFIKGTVWKLSLNEKRISPMAVVRHRVELELGPGEIFTCAFS